MDSIEYVLSIIYRGSSVTVTVCDGDGCTVATATRTFSLDEDKEVHVDPDELLSSVILLLDSTLRKAHVSAEQLSGIGVSAPENAIVLWELNSGSPLGPIEFLHIDPLTFANHHLLSEKIESGLNRDHINQSKEGTIFIGGIESWLIWNLSQSKYCVMATSHCLVMLSGEKSLQSFIFPQPVSCAEQVGHVASPYLSGIPVAITCVTSTSVSAFFGAGLMDQHEAFISYDREGLVVALGAFSHRNDTEETLSRSVEKFRLHAPLLTPIEWILSANFQAPQLILEWLLGSPFTLPKNKNLLEGLIEAHLNNESIVISSSQRSPHHAMIDGISLSTTSEAIYAAALRAMAMAVTTALLDMERLTGQHIYRLYTDTYGFGIPGLFSLQATYANIPVCVRSCDAVSLGTSFLTGLGAKCWNRDKIFEWLSKNVATEIFDAAVSLESSDC